jgi:hypothetical protein
MFRNKRKGNSSKEKSRRIALAGSTARRSTGLRIESLEDRAMLSGTDLDAGLANDPATHLAIFTPPAALAGSAVPVVVVALDANNVPTSDFTDAISLSSTDGSALVSTTPSGSASPVPFDYTFQPSDNGHQLFFITYGANTNGAQTLTAADTTDGTIGDDTANTTVFTPAAATHFAVIVRPNVQAGAPTNVFVEALDANNEPVPNYEGTITLSSSDTAASVETDNGSLTLPQTYSFSPTDHGRHQFQVTFNTVGPQTTISADDSDNGLTGTGTTNVNAATVATHFAVRVQPQTLVGVPATVSVVALDANNHIVQNYSGPVTFSVDNDATASLPAGFSFQPSDHGHTRFQVIFDTPGPENISVSDANAVVTGTASTNVVPAPVASQFLVVLPDSAPANVPIQGFIVALDANGQPVPNYTGTVSFSSDAGATVPDNYTFQPSDYSFHAFTVTFTATGTQSITVTDVNSSTVTGSASVDVTPPQVVSALSIDAPANAPLGLPVLVRVNALDANGNPIRDFAGLLTLTTNDPQATIVPLSSLVPGVQANNLFVVVFGSLGLQTLTATDAADGLSIDLSVNVVDSIFDPLPPPPGPPPGP